MPFLKVLHALPFLPLALAAYCPINGPLLPPPTHLSTSPHFLAAASNLTTLLDSALSGGLNAGFQTNSTSFSIIFTDAHSNLWEYHHTASGNVNGTKNVDGDTQYMVASITKVFTDLAVLKVGLDPEEKVGTYLPELVEGEAVIQWEDVTVGALGSHMAGIQPTYGFPDNYLVNPYLEALGFPELVLEEYPPCGVIGLSGPCSKEQLLDGFQTARPVFPPFSRPVYSSVSFTLLGYILEQVTGKTYAEVLDTEIIQPLGMKNTALQPTNETSGVIPPVDNIWGTDFLDNAPGGGLYSTANDITLLVQGVLSLSILPTPSEVRKWLKPTAETASLYNLVGMPWEITRATDLTPEHPHVIDIYAKDGHVPGYTSRMGVISEYGIGLTVLTAGPSNALNILVEALLSTFVPAIEEATREEAQTYVANFSTPTNSTIRSHIVFEIDDGPGLKISEFVSNSSDMIEGLNTFIVQWAGSSGVLQLEYRLYPAGISETVESNSTTGALTREDWRMVVNPFLEERTSQLPSQQTYDKICMTYMTHDVLYYGGQSVDRFVFLKRGEEVVGVEIPFLRITLMKE